MFQNELTFSQNQQLLARYIREKCTFVPECRMFGKAPGTRYKSQFYLANLTTRAHELDIAVKCMIDVMLENGIDYQSGQYQFCGRVWSALPILGALIQKTSCDGFIMRREKKNYGQHNIIEGIPSKNKTTIIVDDLANSTNSFIFCKNILESMDIPVHDSCLCIFNKKNRSSPDFEIDKHSKQKVMWVVSRDMVENA